MMNPIALLAFISSFLLVEAALFAFAQPLPFSPGANQGFNGQMPLQPPPQQANAINNAGPYYGVQQQPYAGYAGENSQEPTYTTLPRWNAARKSYRHKTVPTYTASEDVASEPVPLARRGGYPSYFQQDNAQAGPIPEFNYPQQQQQNTYLQGYPMQQQQFYPAQHTNQYYRNRATNEQVPIYRSYEGVADVPLSPSQQQQQQQPQASWHQNRRSQYQNNYNYRAINQPVAAENEESTFAPLQYEYENAYQQQQQYHQESKEPAISGTYQEQVPNAYYPLEQHQQDEEEEQEQQPHQQATFTSYEQETQPASAYEQGEHSHPYQPSYQMPSSTTAETSHKTRARNTIG